MNNFWTTLAQLANIWENDLREEAGEEADEEEDRSSDDEEEAS